MTHEILTRQEQEAMVQATYFDTSFWGNPEGGWWTLASAHGGVSSTTTRSGTRKMRDSVSVFGRFKAIEKPHLYENGKDDSTHPHREPRP